RRTSATAGAEVVVLRRGFITLAPRLHHLVRATTWSARRWARAATVNAGGNAPPLGKVSAPQRYRFGLACTRSMGSQTLVVGLAPMRQVPIDSPAQTTSISFRCCAPSR